MHFGWLLGSLLLPEVINIHKKGHIYSKTAAKGGQNINNVYFLDFHPFVDPLISDTLSLTVYDVNQCILGDS